MEDKEKKEVTKKETTKKEVSKENVKTEVKTSSKKGLVIGLTIAIIIIVVASIVTVAVLINNGTISFKNISGKYELCNMKDGDEEYKKEDIAMLKAFGVNVTLELRDDKTGTINVYGEKMDLTYNGKNMIYNEKTVPYTIENDIITLTTDTTQMSFEKVQTENEQ